MKTILILANNTSERAKRGRFNEALIKANKNMKEMSNVMRTAPSIPGKIQKNIKNFTSCL